MLPDVGVRAIARNATSHSRYGAEITSYPAKAGTKGSCTNADMEDTPAKPVTANPYQYEKDDALETFARGVIDEAIAKSTTSPRQFGFFSSAAAKQITQYVLEHFARQKSDG